MVEEVTTEMEHSFQKVIEVVEKCQERGAVFRRGQRLLPRQCESGFTAWIKGHITLQQKNIHTRILQTETSSLIYLQPSVLHPLPSQLGSSEKGCTMVTALILAGKQGGARTYRASQQHLHNQWELHAGLLLNHTFFHIFMQCVISLRREAHDVAIHHNQTHIRVNSVIVKIFIFC